MTWAKGGKGSKFSAKTKHTVRVRDDGYCQLRYPKICIVTGTQFDHIVSIAELGIRRDDPRADDPENIRLVCEPCHKYHSSRQGHAAKRAKRFRPPPQHPGLIRTTEESR